MSDGQSRDRQGGHGPRCEYEDRLVGLLVDGDADGVAADSFVLLDHLAGCARCAGAVAAARRIDALVAETTVRPEPAAVETWLAAAVREPVAGVPGARARSPRPAGRAVQPRGVRVPEFTAVLCAALCVAAVSIWLALRADPGDLATVRGPAPRVSATGASPAVALRGSGRPDAGHAGADRTAAGVPGLAQTEVPDGGLVAQTDVPDGGLVAQTEVPDGGLVTQTDVIILSDRDPQSLHGRLGERIRSGAGRHDEQATVTALLAVARVPGWEPVEAVSAALLLAWRPEVVTALHGWREDVAVAAYARAELAERIRWVGGEGGDRMAQWIDGPARSDRALRARLAQLLRGEPGWSEIAAAAWLGGADLESALLHVAARNRGAHWQAVVAAVRRASERGDRARTLLDLVLQAQGRGGDGDPARSEATLVPQAFAGLGRRVAHELARALPSLRRADERRIALRALGELAAPETSTVLSSVLLGPRVEEAELAAWALGRIAAGADGLADLHPPRRRMDLWRTALVSRRDPLTRVWIDAMDLTEPERELLLAGDFTPTQCGVVARLLGGLDARASR